MNQQTRNFDTESKTWDDNPARVKLAKAVGASIIEYGHVSPSMSPLDFGCGTGLVTLQVQPQVKSILAVDTSRGMLSVLDDKLASAGITNVETKLIDLEHEEMPDIKFDLIFSSMALHHIANPEKLIQRFGMMLYPCGYLCIADLDTENGDFHGGSMGVKHNGFDREWVNDVYTQAGLCDIEIVTAHTMTKEIEEKGAKEFTIFMASGRKPE